MTTSPKNTAAPFVVLPPLREPYFVSTITRMSFCNSSGICGIGGMDMFKERLVRRLERLHLDRQSSYRPGIHDMMQSFGKSCSGDIDAK